MIARFLTGLLLSLTGLGAVAATAAQPQSVDVFRGGADGYHTYRIPALIVSKQGTVLAFCEGRKNDMQDTGRIDLLLKRSTDGGRTWSKQQVVWSDGHNTCGNPCPVVDQATGGIWLLLTWNRGDDEEGHIIAMTSKDTRRPYVTNSADDGRTWSPAGEITAAVKPAEWGWYSTGPGNAIQLCRGPHRGRLVIPCCYSKAGAKGTYFSHTIYSDDHGQSWRLGGTSPEGGVDESAVVELCDGLMGFDEQNGLILWGMNVAPVTC
jgi:sialidase-1